MKDIIKSKYQEWKDSLPWVKMEREDPSYTCHNPPTTWEDAFEAGFEAGTDEADKKSWDSIIEDFKLEFNKKSAEGRIAFSKNILAIFTYPFWELVQDAPNYVEIEMSHKENGQKLTVTIQKNTGKTPHQLRKEAEKDLEWSTSKLILQNNPSSNAYKDASRIRSKWAMGEIIL